MPFKHFLNTSLGFERTHQLILQCLFNDPLFIQVASGKRINEIHVKLEPYNSLFDIGLFDSADECLLLIELKMWSSLSAGQLETQRDFLEKHNCQGLHILLGTSSLQFHRDKNYDEIADYTHDRSLKIGYTELIEILDRFIIKSIADLPITTIAKNYRDALHKQQIELEGAWLDRSSNLHHRCYSAYSKIRNFLLDEQVYMYTVNNAGGADHILNDEGSSTKFDFKGYPFEAYLEMVNLDFLIRISSKDAPVEVKKELKNAFIQEFLKKDIAKLPWTFESKASKYHKIAIYKTELKTIEDCEAIANLFKLLNPKIKEIAQSVSKKESPFL